MRLGSYPAILISRPIKVENKRRATKKERAIKKRIKERKKKNGKITNEVRLVSRHSYFPPKKRKQKNSDKEKKEE